MSECTTIYWKASRVSVSGALYVGCAGMLAAGPSISDTSRIAELIDRVSDRNAQLGCPVHRPLSRGRNGLFVLTMPRNGLRKNSLKMDWYRREEIGGGTNNEGQRTRASV